MNLEQLRQRLVSIRDGAKTILDHADQNADGILSDAEAAKFDELMEQKAKVESAIERLEQMETFEVSTGRRTSDDVRIETHDRVEDDTLKGFQNSVDFANAVKNAGSPGGTFDDRLRILGAPANFHRESSSADGYMVPPAIRQEIWDLVFNDEGILNAVNPEPTESNQVQLYADESTPWGSTGIQAKWASEGTQMDPSRLETEARNVRLHKLYAFVLATEELAMDAPRLQSRLAMGAARAIRWKADEAIVNGDGVGKPLGWFKSNALVTVSKESGQGADTINANNALKMYSRLLQTGAAGAFWLAHQSVIPQLATMTIGQQPVWTSPNQGIQSAPGGMLLGLPVRLSEHAQTLGDKGDIQLIAPAGYYATTKSGGGIDFAASMHLYFDYDIQSYRWTFRLGGQPMLEAPVSQAKGSATLSHMITLAERS